MVKPENESYVDYRKRVLDPISPSFCAAKWLNSTIWLDQGKTTSCHLPPCHSVNRWQILWNPSALHNTTHKKQQRAKMLKGQRPEECDYCWKIEDLNPDAVSDRVFKSVIHSEADIARIARLSADTSVDPSTLEVAFDRICNFACSYCNVDFSTTWAKDLKNNGPYENLKTFDSKTYKHFGSASLIGDSAKNPYIKAFWRWWPKLRLSLKELRVTGGEPLLSPHVWQLIDRICLEKSATMRFALNSNLGVKTSIIEKLVSTSHRIPHFELYTSMEAYGAQAEYIRDGLNFEQWKVHVQMLMESAKVHQINLMMTVNALCLFSITDLFDLLLSWRIKYQRKFCVWTLNILRFPSFMSPLVLPDHIRVERSNHLAKWLCENRNHPWIHDMEIAGLERLVHYLQQVESAHYRAGSKSLQQHDLYQFFSQYDRRREKSIATTFPGAFAEWFESLGPSPTNDL